MKHIYRLRRFILLALFLLAAPACSAQVMQNQTNLTPGRAAKVLGRNLIGDSGPALGGPAGSGLIELGVTNSSPCGIGVTSGPITVGFRRLCLGFNADGTPQIWITDSNLPQLGFNVNIDGSIINFPGGGGGNVIGPNPSVQGHAAEFNNSIGTFLRDAGAPPTLYVPTNAALKALVTLPGQKVIRGGFLTDGDGGGGVTYLTSASSCSAADNGAQVTLTAGGCAIADFTGTQPTPMLWGAKGDGTTDDTAAVAAAFVAMSGKTLWTGPYLYSISAITGPSHLTLIGQRNTGGIYSRTCTYGFIARGATETMFTFTGDNTLFDGVCQQMAAGINTQTAGAAISVGTGNSNIFRNGQINYPFIGIDISGSGGTQNNSNHVEGYVITDPSNAGAGGSGIKVGVSSTGGSTVDLAISHTIIDCVDFGSGLPRANTIGMLFIDAAGGFIHDNDIYGCGIGTKITPLLANQVVQNMFFNNTVLGDTSATNDMFVDGGPAASNAVGLGFVFQNSWTASAAGTSVILESSGGGSLTGIHFIGHRFFPATNQIALDIKEGIDLTFSASMFCTQSGTSGDLIRIEDSAQLLKFTDNEIGTCEGFSGAAAQGINVTSGSVGAVQIQNNNFFGSTVPINWTTSSATTALINGNLGLDSITPSIASSGTITLGFGKTTQVTGTNTVSTINGIWSAREATIIPTGALPFTTGGNICNALTATANVPVLAIWNANGPCWQLK